MRRGLGPAQQPDLLSHQNDHRIVLYCPQTVFYQTAGSRLSTRLSYESRPHDERFIALVPRFSVLTSFLVVACGLKAACRFTRTGEAGAETTRLEGFAPIRDLPLGGSLSRTVLLGCS